VVVSGVDPPSNDFTGSRNDIDVTEDFVERETGSAGSDPAAPAQAGPDAHRPTSDAAGRWAAIPTAGNVGLSRTSSLCGRPGEGDRR
jgi:hypothetical protein